MKHGPLRYLLPLCLSWLPAKAEVLDAASNGFTVSHSVVVTAGRAEAYGIAVTHIDEWWSGEHTMSGDAGNLYIDAKPNGCFCEELGPDGGLIHLTVTFVNPGMLLRLTGGLGPLGLMGVSGNMTWEFSEQDDGTMLTLTYAVGGYLKGGLDSVAGAVDAVLVEQLSRYRLRVDTGENQNSP
jgi:hypothetical protein